ncbi:MAG: ATPase [Pseudopedobacter saltans]|uniref:ATPase n=1 Tax=Pseudopedobacter saltans TaxID=151895 RepID=A0A2W5F2B9_9SPHI|nr:MAG: ATPase [Pseudopedobacter saltans]
MSAITIQNITKTYKMKHKVIQALDDICLTIEHGELFGLIGPDGAGKTSLFRILTTLLLSDSGNASVLGLDVRKKIREIRAKVGYMPGRFSLYQDLTILENLNFFANIFGTTIEAQYDQIKDIYQQIEPFKNRRAGALSGGMKQKLALCCALVHKPEVLFLDEPTTGVDPVSRKEFWAILKHLNENGLTILVSTPYMDEASMCQRIALMQDGKIMSINKPDNIVENFSKKLYAVKSEHNYKLLKLLRSKDYVDSCFMFGDQLHITFHSEFVGDDIPSNATVKEINPEIEDCFIDLMQNKKEKNENN